MNKFFYILLVVIGFNCSRYSDNSIFDTYLMNKSTEKLQKMRVYEYHKNNGTLDQCPFSVLDVAKDMPKIATSVSDIDSLEAMSDIKDAADGYDTYGYNIYPNADTENAINSLRGIDNNKEVDFKYIAEIMNGNDNFLQVCKNRISASFLFKESFFYYLKQCAIDTNDACLAQLRGERASKSNPLADTIAIYDSKEAQKNRANLGRVIFDIIHNRDVFCKSFPAVFTLLDAVTGTGDANALSLMFGNRDNIYDRNKLSNFFDRDLSIRGLEIWYEFLFLIQLDGSDHFKEVKNFGVKFNNFIKDLKSTDIKIEILDSNIESKSAYSFAKDIFLGLSYRAPHLCKTGAWTVHSGMGIILALAGVKDISLRRLIIGGIAEGGWPNAIKGAFLSLPYNSKDHTINNIQNIKYNSNNKDGLNSPVSIFGAYKQAFRDPTTNNGYFGHVKQGHGVGGTDLSTGTLGICNLFALAFGFKAGETYDQNIGTIVGGLTAANLKTFLETYTKYIRINFRLPYTSGDFDRSLFPAGVAGEFGDFNPPKVPHAPWYCIGDSNSDANANPNDVATMGAMYFYGALKPSTVAGGAFVDPNNALAAALVVGDRPVTESYYIKNMSANDFTAVAKEYETL